MRFVATIVVLAALSAPDVLACSCIRRTEAEQFASAHRVFRGTVMHAVDRANGFRRMWMYFRELIGREVEWNDWQWHGYLVEFEVDRTLKGSPARRAKIFTGRGGGDCGYEFEVGKRYVVYARCKPDGTCFTSICSGTRRD